MTELTIDISKEAVYEEVAQTTSYTGAKMEGDAGAYDRIFTTDADRGQLERFWNESCVAVCETLKEFVRVERNTKEGLRLELCLSSAFDPALEGAMKKELFSFFVTNIAAKWYVFSNKKEAADYAAMGAVMLDGVKRKAYYRRKPRRPARIMTNQ